MNDLREKALELVNKNGPLIPSQISKEIGKDIMFSSAILSELVSSNKIKISSVKIGGSPLYYASGQEEKLQNYSEKLNEKERKAYELLKERKLLRDSKLEPLTRFCLRQIKDFAKPLEVTAKGSSELFWSWYLTPNEETEKLIEKELLSDEPKPEIIPEPQEKPATAAVPSELKISEPSEAAKEEAQIPKKAVKKRITKAKEDFRQKILDYFGKKGIEIVEEKIIKKNSEIDFVIKIPSEGKTEHYCKARNKKKCNDADIGVAFANGQLKNMPVFILAQGEITKKGKALLEKLQNTRFEKITYS